MTYDVTRLTRNQARGSDQRADLDALLAATPVGVVSSVLDGEPWSIPMLVARDGDRILIHGSTGAGLLRRLGEGAPATVTLFQLDAAVVAHTAFECSVNYRSAVLRGTFSKLEGDDKARALEVLTDRVIPGRTLEVRPMTGKEIAATTVLAMPIEDGSWLFKARSGPAGFPEDTADAVVDGVPVWAGIVPFVTVAGTPVADSWVPEGVAVPDSVWTLRNRHQMP